MHTKNAVLLPVVQIKMYKQRNGWPPALQEAERGRCAHRLLKLAPRHALARRAGEPGSSLGGGRQSTGVHPTWPVADSSECGPPCFSASCRAPVRRFLKEQRGCGRCGPCPPGGAPGASPHLAGVSRSPQTSQLLEAFLSALLLTVLTGCLRRPLGSSPHVAQVCPRRP